MQYPFLQEQTKKANFENTYDAQTTIQFTGRKVLNNKALNEDEFEFQISGFNIGEEHLLR